MATFSNTLNICNSAEAGADRSPRSAPWQLTWVDATFLRRDQELHSFTDLPLWAPLDEDAGFYQIDGSAAIQSGAVYRSIRETAAATLLWFQSYFFKDIRFPYQGRGISADREDEILAAWWDSRPR